MSVILRKRKNANGTTSLRLDISHEGKRWPETLKQLQLVKPTSPAAREANKYNYALAEKIAVNRAHELQINDYNIVADSGKKTMVAVWMQTYVDGYSKKDKRNMQGALNRFKTFLAEQKKSGLTFGHLSALIIESFMDFLESKSKGEGASSYYFRFKKMIKHAYRQRLMQENVLDFVERKIKGKAGKKDILTLAELKILAATPVENKEIRRAFLFTCVTGLRWIDIKSLKWNSINIANKQLNILQNKTGEQVSIPLNDTALSLLSTPDENMALVFNLPSANGANKTLKAWVKRAKLCKAITWHNGRHSYGSNLIFNDVDVLTTSKLLGHTSMKHTQRYVRIVDEMKEKATNRINIDI